MWKTLHSYFLASDNLRNRRVHADPRPAVDEGRTTLTGYLPEETQEPVIYASEKASHWQRWAFTGQGGEMATFTDDQPLQFSGSTKSSYAGGSGGLSFIGVAGVQRLGGRQ